MKKLFSIYDRKANCYGAIITAVNSDTACRIVDPLLFEASSDYCRYPSDFDLVEIGSFASASGAIVPSDRRIIFNLGSRKEYLQVLYSSENQPSASVTNEEKPDENA